MQLRGLAARCARRTVAAMIALTACVLSAPTPALGTSRQPDRVPMPRSSLAGGPVITLNDNGAWSWFQDQRAIFTSDDRLLVGSIPNPGGPNGAARTSSVEATTYDIRTGLTTIDRLHAGLGNDDHNAPAFIETHPGRVVTAWTGHASEPAVHTATEDADSLSWDLPAPIPRADTAAGKKVSYSNLLLLRAENGGRGRLYDFYRGEEFNPNLLISDDEGRNWRYGGRLFTVPGQRPYVRYSSNGTNRIDFIASEGNPAEFDGTSVRAGYVQGGSVHNSQGTVLGPLDGSVRFSQLTPVFDGRPSAAGGTSDTDAWTSDIEQDGAGRPVVAFSVRLPTPPAAAGTGRFDHRYYVGRWTGSAWQVQQVAFAGGELYRGQNDYTGTIAIDPADPNHAFISTNVDPRTGGSIVSSADGRAHWEIYEGRSNSGGPWTWTAVTANSASDNIRPTAIAGPGGDFALLWLRGRYPSYISYNLRVMGIVRATPTSRTRVPPTRVGGTATVTAGRFGGGSRDDLFVSGPGPAGDGFLVAGSPRRRLVAKPLRQTYSFQSFNPQGSGPDTLLALPTNASLPARTWRLNANTSITSGSLARPAQTRPIIGDFNGDGRDDILWYGPGATRDQLWRARPGGGFTIQAVKVTGTYRPVAGDVDGDGRDDIIWYGPGATSDSIWHFRPDGGHDVWPIRVTGNYRPVAGDLDADHHADIVWNAPGAAADFQWDFVGRTGSFVSSRRILPSAATPTIGDFNGDQRDDIFWNAAGNQPDAIWPGGIPPA